MALLVAAAPAEVSVATVDGEGITSSELVARGALVAASGATLKPEQLLEVLINERLLAAEGYRQGLAKDPAVVAAAKAELRRQVSELFIKREIDSSTKVDDAEALELFHDARDSAQLSLIVVASKDEATQVLARLEKGADFATEAKSSLNADQGKQGGDLGTVTRGALEPALREAAFKGPLGKATGPVQLALGWGVVKVRSREVPDNAQFEASKEQFRRFAEGQYRAAAKTHVLARYRAQAKVALDEAFLRSTGASLAPTAEEAQRVLATVAGEPLRYGEVVADVQALFGSMAAGHMSGPSVKTDVAWKRIDERLLAEAGIKLGLEKDPAVTAAVRRTERDAVVRALATRLRAAAPAPTVADAQAYFAAHAADFKQPGYRTCSHLVVAEQETAKKLRGRLAKAEPFEALAADYSRDPQSAKNGGAMGQLTDELLDGLAKPDAEPAFALAVRTLKPGEVSEPVKTRAGWHLVRCEAPVAAGVVPFEQVKQSIASRLQADRAEAAVNERIAALRARARITVDRAALNRVPGAPAQGGTRP